MYRVYYIEVRCTEYLVVPIINQKEKGSANWAVSQLSNDKDLEFLLSLTVSQLWRTGCVKTNDEIKKYFWR